MISETRYRYERKFLTSLFPAEALDVIRLNSAGFTEQYAPRVINNIYFDTPGFDYYFANIEGERKRVKVRIRWYGENADVAARPVLELKLKNGLFGEKRTWPIQEFRLPVDYMEIRKLIKRSPLPPDIKHLMDQLYPVLLNRYKRLYFISRNHKFRLTLDDKLTYFAIAPGLIHTSHPHGDFTHRVFELKYAVKLDDEAARISNQFPFRLTKNSKYLSGVELVCL